MMMACGNVYYVGEHVQADSVWKSIKSTTDDAFLSGLCFPNPGDILPHPGDFVVNKMDGYTVCLMVEKIFLDTRHNHRLVLKFQECKMTIA